MSHLDLDGLNAKQYEAVMHSEGLSPCARWGR